MRGLKRLKMYQIAKCTPYHIYIHLLKNSIDVHKYINDISLLKAGFTTKFNTISRKFDKGLTRGLDTGIKKFIIKYSFATMAGYFKHYLLLSDRIFF